MVNILPDVEKTVELIRCVSVLFIQPLRFPLSGATFQVPPSPRMSSGVWPFVSYRRKPFNAQRTICSMELDGLPPGPWVSSGQSNLQLVEARTMTRDSRAQLGGDCTCSFCRCFGSRLRGGSDTGARLKVALSATFDWPAISIAPSC